MEIECPSCKELNKIEYAENIVCAKCEETLSGHIYKRFKKPLISTTFVASLAAISGYKFNNSISEDRYPIIVEYELVNSCASSQLKVLSQKSVKEITEICTCALEKSLDDYDYSAYKENERQFISHFSHNIYTCD